MSTPKKTMELVDRYLQAVRFWLPTAQEHDIIAELSEDLHSQIEEKETELGRSLTEPEMDAILKHRGRPLLVANRYLPQSSLIGPVLFPIYRFVLKLVAGFYLLPWILTWIGMMSFSPSYRAEHMSAGWLGAIASAWSSWWLNACFTLGVVTTVFAVLEHFQAKSRFLEDWSPRKLPPARNPNQIPRSGSVIEVVVNPVFVVWWINAMSTQVLLNRPEIRIVLSPVWRYFFWGFLLLALVNTVVAGVNLARPYWTVLRAGLRLATNCAASALFCWMSRANLLAEISGSDIPTARAYEVINAINLWMGRVFPVVLATAVVIAILDARRILRVRKASTGQVKFTASAAVV